jgi:hypothetical protein
MMKSKTDELGRRWERTMGEGAEIPGSVPYPVISEQSSSVVQKIEDAYKRSGGKFAPKETKTSESKSEGPSITRTGTLNGRKVIQYSDGTTKYAD